MVRRETSHARIYKADLKKLNGMAKRRKGWAVADVINNLLKSRGGRQ